MAGRMLSASARQNGLAVEYLMALAESLSDEPWVSMPHLADDDFVRNFAQSIDDALEPNRTAFVAEAKHTGHGLSGMEMARRRLGDSRKDRVMHSVESLFTLLNDETW